MDVVLCLGMHENADSVLLHEVVHDGGHLEVEIIEVVGLATVVDLVELGGVVDEEFGLFLGEIICAHTERLRSVMSAFSRRCLLVRFMA